MKYIDADKLIERLEEMKRAEYENCGGVNSKTGALQEVQELIESLQEEQPEVDLKEEAYMRGFAQGAKEERERMLEDIKEIHGKAATEFAVHLVRTNSEPDCTTAKCGIRYALNSLLSWLKTNGYDMDAKE